MSIITLRVPEYLDRQIRDMASQSHQSLSELARQALEQFVIQKQKDMELASMALAVRFMTENTEVQSHTKKLTETFVVVDDEIEKEHNFGEPQWWKS